MLTLSQKYNNKKKTNSEITDCCDCFRHWCQHGSIAWEEVGGYPFVTSFLTDYDVPPQIFPESLGAIYCLQDERFCLKYLCP